MHNCRLACRCARPRARRKAKGPFFQSIVADHSSSGSARYSRLPVRPGPTARVDIFGTSLIAPEGADESRAGPAPAGLARRLAALAYDALLLCGLLAILTLLILVFRGGRVIEPGTAWFTLATFACVLAFFVGFWRHGGQTLGMMAWQIELRSASGRPVSLRQALVRFAAAWLSLAPCGLGFLWAVFDHCKRTWHDRLAGTLVVRTEPRASIHKRAAAASAQAYERDETDGRENERRRPGDDERIESESRSTV